MKKIFLTSAMILTLITLFSFITPTSWRVTDQYNISFATSGTSGIFKGFTGNVLFEEQNLAASKFDITIDINSINTGNGMMNKHARGADWFDAAKYPSIKYTSKKIAKSGAGYTAIGDLTLHGITKEVSLPFNFKRNAAGGVFEGVFSINRNDFKIGQPGGEVGDLIRVTVSMPVTK